MSPETADHRTHKPRLMDELDANWDPARISDRKLSELKAKLDKVRLLGDAFAKVQFSPYLQARLREPKGGDPRNPR